MRRLLAAVIVLPLALVASGCLVGCGFPATPEELAEKSLTSSFESVNGFLRVEHANRDLVAREMPDVHKFAEDARREYPPAHRLALAALELYRALATKESEGELNARRLAIDRFSATARAYLASINERRPKVELLPGATEPERTPANADRR